MERPRSSLVPLAWLQVARIAARHTLEPSLDIKAPPTATSGLHADRAGDGEWGFSGQWSLRAVGKSSVVATTSDFLCEAGLPKSDLTSGVTVMGVHSLTGWAACRAMKKTDAATLEMFYEPPFVSPNGGQAPTLWFALH